MARFGMGLAPNFAVELDYNANNRRVSSLVVTNTTGANVYAEAVLSDGRIFGQTFGQGSTTLGLPGNVVTLTIDGAGEAAFGGLASVATRIPA